MSDSQRRKKFIDADVQGALVRRIVFHWAVFLTVALVVSFVLQLLSNPFRPLQEHLRGLWMTHGPFLLVVVFLLPVLIVDTIKISHRFAGPIFGLRRAMREVASGKAPRALRFRANDFWHDLADDYNALLRRLAPAAFEDAPSAASEEPLSVESAK